MSERYLIEIWLLEQKINAPDHFAVCVPVASQLQDNLENNLLKFEDQEQKG